MERELENAGNTRTTSGYIYIYGKNFKICGKYMDMIGYDMCGNMLIYIIYIYGNMRGPIERVSFLMPQCFSSVTQGRSWETHNLSWASCYRKYRRIKKSKYRII